MTMSVTRTPVLKAWRIHHRQGGPTVNHLAVQSPLDSRTAVPLKRAKLGDESLRIDFPRQIWTLTYRRSHILLTMPPCPERLRAAAAPTSGHPTTGPLQISQAPNVTIQIFKTLFRLLWLQSPPLLNTEDIPGTLTHDVLVVMDLHALWRRSPSTTNGEVFACHLHLCQCPLYIRFLLTLMLVTRALGDALKSQHRLGQGH